MKKRFVCQNCGYESIRWLGRCPSCNAWSSFVEEVVSEKRSGTEPTSPPIELDRIEPVKLKRTETGFGELDRVLGGGLVGGSLILLGGDPGIGKSTLMLQVAAHLAPDQKVLYVTGEESAEQIRMRADRLNIRAKITVLAETNLDQIATWIERTGPEFLIIDSIQTIFDPDFSGAPGSVGQVRECGNRIMRLTKAAGIITVLIGHVTKVGAIAGPKTLEHIVDTVLYFEGDRNQRYRIIRAFKNRFGPTNEVGVFEMTDAGLVEVDNPSSIFLMEDGDRIGSSVIATMEGTRSLLVEVQSLANPTYFNYPQRQTSGIDYRRFILLLAVIEQKLSLPIRQYDIFVNVVGGIRIDEPAADFGIATAIISAIKSRPVPKGLVVIGEIGLGGELRPVPNIETRVKEAEKLGFKQCLIPPGSKGLHSGIEVIRIRDVRDGAKLIFGE